MNVIQIDLILQQLTKVSVLAANINLFRTWGGKETRNPHKVLKMFTSLRSPDLEDFKNTKIKDLVGFWIQIRI